MKNFERWEKEIKKIIDKGDMVALYKGFPIECKGLECIYCDLQSSRCKNALLKWLYQEYVENPKLNKYEHSLCEVLCDGWLARDKEMRIFYYPVKPIKSDIYWWQPDCPVFDIGVLRPFSEMLKFYFIKWEDEEPWSIEELLKLEIIEEC